MGKIKNLTCAVILASTIGRAVEIPINVYNDYLVKKSQLYTLPINEYSNSGNASQYSANLSILLNDNKEGIMLIDNQSEFHIDRVFFNLNDSLIFLRNPSSNSNDKIKLRFDVSTPDYGVFDAAFDFLGSDSIKPYSQTEIYFTLTGSLSSFNDLSRFSSKPSSFSMRFQGDTGPTAYAATDDYYNPSIPEPKSGLLGILALTALSSYRKKRK